MFSPMTDRSFRIPLGDTTISVQAPPGWRVSVAEQPDSALPDPPPVFALGTALATLARSARNAVIAFTDATRACPDDILIPPMLAQLHEAGVPDDGITLLCAVGMHRPISQEETIAKLGAAIAGRYRVVSHDPADVVSLGEVDGVPLQVNRLCAEADLVLATGVVEPHQYAGWSGGSKTVAIGCGGPGTIAATHSPRFIDDPSVRVGRMAGNTFQRVVQESARRLGLKYVVNVGLSEGGEIVAQASGPPEEVQARLIDVLLSLYEVSVDAPFDMVIAGVGHPKDVNLYQASRAATYIGLSQHPILRPGGVIILPATCPEGAGHGVGERNFLYGMASAPDLDSLLDRLRREGCRPGEQRAFIVGKVLREHPIIVVGAQDPDIVRACHMTPAADMLEAFRLVGELSDIGDEPDVLVVPHATQTLPVPRGASR